MSKAFRENLKQFNRKERFFLIAKALQGGEESSAKFALSDGFRTELGRAFDLEIPRDAEVFAAMDYHLDWLYASVFLAQNHPNGDYRDLVFDLEESGLKANQEDVDFLVAFGDPSMSDVTDLLLIEAKLDTPWSNKQARSKLTRLVSLFGEDGKKVESIVRPKFAFMSPKRPNLASEEFPHWCLDGDGVRHMELRMGTRLMPTRCDGDGRGNYRSWRVEVHGDIESTSTSSSEEAPIEAHQQGGPA